MPEVEGYLVRDGRRTWYRVVGGGDGVPVVICHGGPGATHDYVEPIARLHRDGRACVLYDQLGNGRSDHLPGADPSFWSADLFRRELTALVAHLGIADRYHVIGQSWGGMLALLHALERPPGLVSVVAADSPASMHDFVTGCNELLDAMPADVAATIREGERTGETATDEFQAAVMEFYRRHVCRLNPWPDCVVRSFAAVDVPVLLVSGVHDEVRPWVVEKMQARLRNCEWELFEDSSHMPHVEEHERFLKVVKAFLARVEGA